METPPILPLLDTLLEVELELPDHGVVVFDQREVDLRALARIGFLKRLCHPSPVRLVGDLGRRFGQVVLVVRNLSTPMRHSIV